MITTVSHAIKDRAGSWDANFQAPPVFDVKTYQENLNKIAGFTQQGEPVLRLVWGGSEFRMGATNWDSWGNPMEWGKVPRYAYESKRIETWGQRIPIRRWIIEENTDAGQLESLGGKNHGDIQVPEKGFYTPYIIIADHSKCPPDCPANEFKCFGDYKAPGPEELLFITEVTYKLLASRKQDPRKGLDMDLVAQMVKSETPDGEAVKAAEEEENRAFIDDWLNIHLPIRSISKNAKSLNHANSSNDSKSASQV